MMKAKMAVQLAALAVVLLTVASLLVACGGSRENEITGSGEQSNTSAGETTIMQEQTESVKLDGEAVELTAEFVLLVGDRSNDSILMLANSLKKKISAKTGINLSLGHEDSKKDKEIILGYNATREATSKAYEALGQGEYGIYMDGSTFVLGGWTNEDVSAAADLLMEKALVQENGKWMIRPYAVENGDASPASVDLSLYRIVYPADAGAYLKNTVIPHLQDRLKAIFGVMPEIVPDSEAPAEYEISVGQTNRVTDSVRAHMETSGRTNYLSYMIATEGHRVYLLSQAEVSLYSAAEDLCEYAIPEVGPAIFCLRAEPYVSSGADSKDKVELAAGADIRVMSYNILHPNWSNVTDKVPVEGRDANFAKILMYYMPDVAGIQEVNAAWHSSIRKLLVDTGMYKQACKMKSNGKDYNLTTLLYNPNTVKLIDEYVLDLDAGSNIRVFSVAVFEKLSDGTRFVVTNTHPAPTSQAENYRRNFADMMTIAQKEMAKYADLPFIMTGDFNTGENAAMYQTLINTVKVKDAKYDAETLVRKQGTFLKGGWGGSFNNDESRCIDHIFINDKADAKLFNVVIDHDVEKTSDHIPIYADIDLK